MKRKAGLAGILLASSFWLGGCALWEGVGPCYGFGCHAGLTTPHAQSAQSAPADENTVAQSSVRSSSPAKSTARSAPKQGD